MDQAAHIALVPSTLREEENIDIYNTEVVYMATVKEEFKEVAVEEAENEVTTPIHYLIQMVMEP